MPQFSSILDESSDNIERPKPIPAGSYNCIVQGLPRRDKSSKKQTPFIEFTLRPISAGDDVDEAELQEMGGLDGKTLRATYYYTEGDRNSLWRLKEFLEHCGVDLDGKSISSAIEEAPNSSVLAIVRHESSDDGSAVYAKIQRTAPAE